MESLARSKALPVVVAACCGALVASAVFSRGGLPWHNNNVRVAGATGSTLGTTANGYVCSRCGRPIEWGHDFCPWCGSTRLRLVTPAAAPGGATAGLETEVEPLARNGVPAAATAAGVARAAATPVANTTPVANMVPAAGAATAGPGLLSPREQNAAGKEFIEGHWLGLEVIPLTPELAKEYGVPPGEKGILVDEITLESAESGILAGDMVQSVDGRPTPDLKAFFLATQRAQEQERAAVGISRRGEAMTFFMEARNTAILGFAQMEAAQPIKPGALSPHRSRNKACTECHIIMLTGGQLPTDAGDIAPTVPAITRAAIATHGDRGACASCHVIK